MFYWLTSNFWTMGQQFLVIRNMPTPGSEAALAREARLAKKNRNKMKDDADGDRRGRRGDPEDHPATAAGRQEPSQEEERKPMTEQDEQQVPTSSQQPRRPRRARAELEEEGDIAADYIEELLDITDLDGDIDIDARAGRAYLSVTASGESNLRLLSKPDTVTALQELTRIAVQNRTGRFSRLILDIGGSRDARAAELASLVDHASSASRAARRRPPSRRCRATSASSCTTS